MYLLIDIRAFKTVSHCNISWHRLVYSQETNSFELSLVVQVSDGGDSHRSSERSVLGSVFQKKVSSAAQPHTFERMAEVSDNNWKRPVPRSVYLLYPQALDMTQVVANITHCLPIPEASIFNQTVRFLNVSSNVCVPEKAVDRPLNAIVVIKSAVYNFADRERLRRAYANETEREPAFRMAMVFSLGLPRSSGGRFFQRDGINISLPGREGASLEKMKSQRLKVLRKLAEEAQCHGDLVVGDYEDTYYNLSLKLFHTFQWASGFCRGHVTHQPQRPPVFVLMDDDYAFSISRLKAELGALLDAQIRRVALGYLMNGSKVLRPLASRGFEQWTVSKRQVPWPYYTPYSSGAFLVLGANVLQEIALTVYFTVQFSVDDAWLSMVMSKLDLYAQRRPHMYM
ncbi:unnamed protein product [Dibothriocephalus latus]|uniref:Hexosyltransferase n=1 Tax=Dibothriocephalus latus TaxID=60516 RepID=A0A3P7L5U4_DIBLA|nr:unnamed protein product [Dibothriocephalus latus]